ncbi:MAG: IS5 family transposase [Myxococcales bacterium]|nr:IS5 family transposase [Myxococcales bacterium]
MRGKSSRQPSMFYAIDVDEMVPANHPLRPIKAFVDTELGRMSKAFDKAYSQTGRPSIPPERLLKALLLQALFSIRSERQLVEQIRFNLLYRWFIGMDPAEDAFDATTFTKNRDRLARYGITSRFFEGIVREMLRQELASEDHFTVDGTLIRAHASMKSLQPIESGDDDPSPPEGKASRNTSVDFRGTRRTNATHRSTTDPEARLYSKGGSGTAAYLCHTAHLVTENRNGLIVAVAVDEANGLAEREQALVMVDDIKRQHRLRAKTLGADKGYDGGSFFLDLEGREIEPHVALRDGPIKGETEESQARLRVKKRQRRRDYRISQRKRKIVEEPIGWLKTVGGLMRTPFVGQLKLRLSLEIKAAAYNLVRMAKLIPT